MRGPPCGPFHGPLVQARQAVRDTLCEFSFQASKDLVRDGADESWTAIHVPNSAEGVVVYLYAVLLCNWSRLGTGFRFDDVQLPSNSDSGLSWS